MPGVFAFGWTHQMIVPHGDMVVLMDIFAYKSYDDTPKQSEASFGESDLQRLQRLFHAQ